LNAFILILNWFKVSRVWTNQTLPFSDSPMEVPLVHPKRNRNAQKNDQEIQEIQKTQLVWIGRFVVCFHGDALSRENSPTHRQ